MAFNSNNSRRSSSGSTSSRSRSRSNSGSMTAAEAGHLGGTAPHRCRGFQCQQQTSKSRSR